MGRYKDYLKNIGIQKTAIFIILLISLVLIIVAFSMNLKYYHKTENAANSADDNTDILKNIVKNY